MGEKQEKEIMEPNSTCRICGHRLTDPKSVELGIGPVCLKKVSAHIEYAAAQAEQDALAGQGIAEQEAEARAKAEWEHDEEEKYRHMEDEGHEEYDPRGV